MKQIDFWIFLPALFLSTLGLVALFSIAPEFFKPQLIFLGISLLVFFFVSQIDASLFIGLSAIGYLLSLLLLGLTLLFGSTARGAARWLGIGQFRFQPSEIVKPLLILFFAKSLSLRGAERRGNLQKSSQFLGLIEIFKSALTLFLPIILIFLQPDLGSSLLVLAIWLGILLAKGVDLKIIFGGGLLFLLILPLAWKLLAPYQKERLVNFLNPSKNLQGANYSQVQAKISIGSGQFLGKGLGHGTQSVLKFLPEYQSDFIFAAFAEEWGFMGITLMLALYFIFFARLLSLAGQAKDEKSLVFIGIFSFFFFQFAIHAGMNLGILPITGITLPFISAGGSSLLASWASLGIAMAMVDK